MAFYFPPQYPGGRGVEGHDYRTLGKRKSALASPDPSQANRRRQQQPSMEGTVLMLALQFLGPPDVQSCAQVCRRWNEDISKDEVWRQVVQTMIDNLAKSSGDADATRIFACCMDTIKGISIPMNKRIQYAELITELNGIPAIMDVFKSPSIRATGYAVFTLANLTFYSKESRKIISSTDIPMVLNAAKRLSAMDRQYVVSMFNNLAITGSANVATDECIDFVVQVMKDYPQRADIQETCCVYFPKIGKDEVVKQRVRGKKICGLLARVIDNDFEGIHGGEQFKRGAHKAARAAMAFYFPPQYPGGRGVEGHDYRTLAPADESSVGAV